MIFGGLCDDITTKVIAKYTPDQWEHIGNLQSPRRLNRAIANENRIYVVGGGGIQYVDLENIIHLFIYSAIQKSGFSMKTIILPI